MNNNYSPIYDNRGQIIGTINPETGQLGKEAARLIQVQYLQLTVI